jgi:serine/threonine-protein kinase ATR
MAGLEEIIIPTTNNLLVSALPIGRAPVDYAPFSRTIPCIRQFEDKAIVLTSLQRPRKITIQGTDGQQYHFLCKPKDDLRKDARLMEFNSIVNKLLMKDPESRRRQLRIRTYAVVPLNEECGILEWV